MKSKYGILLIILSIHSERLHRKVFDKYYQQDYNIYGLGKLVVWYHKLLVKLLPEYRQYLKFYKAVLNRGYSQHRLNISNHLFYKCLESVNVIRYSDYFNN